MDSLIELFHRYDTNNDGVIDREELEQVFLECYHGWMKSPEQLKKSVDAAFNDFDYDGDNFLNLNEFIHFLLHVPF